MTELLEGATRALSDVAFELTFLLVQLFCSLAYMGVRVTPTAL